MDFPMGFWLFLICFINVFFEAITNYKSDKLCFVKDYIWKHICIIWWCPVRPRNLYYRLGPVDLKIYTLVTEIPRPWLDSWKNLYIFAKIIRLYGMWLRKKFKKNIKKFYLWDLAGRIRNHFSEVCCIRWIRPDPESNTDL